MGKEKSIHKQIANAIKAKGLQKLRWYCELCKKQCRDANGFKCHLTSEGHKRQIMLFGQSPDKFVEDFSAQFLEDFLDVMRRSHPNTRVHANEVYQEVIQDRHHVHMNSTKWLTLTDFVKFLGREGLCKVEETDKGWFIRLVVEDPFRHMQQSELAKRAAAEEANELRRQKEILAQVERARAEAAEAGEAGPVQGTELKLDAVEDPIRVSLKPVVGAVAAAKAAQLAAFGDGDDDGTEGGPREGEKGPKRKPALEAIMEQEMAKKARTAQRQEERGRPSGAEAGPGPSSWLREGIVVKVLSKALKDHGYYKKKGAVRQVLRGVVGEIEMLDSGDVLQVDVCELETVVPKEGGEVVVLRGVHAGERGVLDKIDTAGFRARVWVGGHGGDGAAQDVWLPYEDFSKAA